MTSDNVSEVISKALAAIDHELKCPVGTNAVNPPSEVCKIKAGIEKEIMVLLVAKKMDEIAAVYEMLGTALGCRHAVS